MAKKSIETTYILSIIVLLLTFLSDNAMGQGLRFNGLDYHIDERTSYTVFGNRHPAFTDIVDISFKMQHYSDAEQGVILRMTNRNEPDVPAIILFYDGATDYHRFYVNIEKRRTALTLTFPKKVRGKESEWMNVDMHLMTDRDSIMLAVDRDTAYAAIDFLQKRMTPDIVFGRSKYLIDLPSFAIRDLQIGDRSEVFRFPLDEQSGNVVHGTNSRMRGHVENPVWLAENQHKWVKATKIYSKEFLCAGYDENIHEVRIFSRDSLYRFNIHNGEYVARAFRNRCPVSLTIGTNFLDGRTGRLYAYEVNYDKPWKGPVTVASLDTAALTWRPLSEEQLPTQLHHHAEWVDTVGGYLYIYGGFGNMEYNGSFYRYDIDHNHWEKCPDLQGAEPLFPRYFCAMGYSRFDNSLYIYGGMGNESGQQIVGRDYFYDLYKVNPTDFSVEKKWSTSWNEEANTVAARNMVICEEDSFYALCYPESVTESQLQLYRFSMKDGSRVKLGNTIPIFSDKITTNANLYYDASIEKMIALVEESTDDVSSSVSIYWINYPPKEPIVESAPLIETDTTTWIRLAVIAGMIVCIGLALYWRRLYRRSRNKGISFYDKHSSKIQPIKERPNCIFLFGSTQIISSTGEDISGMLTIRLKEMLLLILQHTASGGISSRRLSSLIWPDKDEDKSKNVRGVTLNNLRKVLSCLDGVNLVFQDGKYIITCSEPAFCDYLTCIRMFESYKPGNDLVLSILSRGKFLMDDGNILFDRMKDEIEEKVVAAMLAEAEWRFQNEDWANTILCADIMFRIDPLNENALSYAVRAFKMSGNIEEAKVRYNNFITQYKKDYDEDYPSSFQDISETGQNG